MTPVRITRGRAFVRRAGTTLLKHGETREAQYIIFIPGRARELNLYQPDKKVTFV